ncbi:co-chaperone YbbN [Gulosibacter bifidus]|uniref:Co-chaperone YbbN n=1 Tax=Gulosibacter bifidus TaxID=272239 RepID=A0ABW5RI43_9MICO|nr:co-chaperone YbbN [Gulosibacter bifidus]
MNSIPNSMRGAVDLSGLGQSNGAGAAGAPQPGQPGPAAQAAPQAGAAAQPGQQGDAIATLPDVVIDGGQAELEQLAPLSAQLPVLVEMYSAAADEQHGQSALAEVVRSAQGRLVLLRINLDADPALGTQQQTIMLLGGRPAPLFEQTPPREQVIQVINELLAAAQQQGMTGVVAVEGGADAGGTAAAEPAAKPLPPLHQEAQDALAQGDLDGAKLAYTRALEASPADDEARIGLARVGLLERLRGKTLAEIRDRAASAPDDLDAQLDVADLDLSGGHVVDAFERLLGMFPKVDADGKSRIRERLLDMFDIVGAADARVVRARQQLTNLLFA